MDRLEYGMLALNGILDTKEKRHLAGGVLMSISLLFVGLSITILTIKQEDNYDDIYK